MREYIDACAYIGAYPFRKVEHTSARDLVAAMDEYGITQAIVSSLPAIYYRDVRDGNLELMSEIAPFRGRLIPAATGNPVYNCAMEDLERYAGEFGCREVRLFPRQHGYQLTDEKAVRYLRRAAELSVAVALPLYVEDPRQRHVLDILDPVGAAEIRDAAVLAPETDFVLHNAGNLGYAHTLAPVAASRTGAFYYDFGRTDCLYSGSLQQMIALAGEDHILFATSQPLQYPDPAFVKMAFLPEKAGLQEATLELIASGNARRLFAL
ncbi:MAG: amidohydrolase family protein [Clostridiaceae bacterium]|nr:amidohydrolase family protein [Clostridiaceae bacterium]